VFSTIYTANKQNVEKLFKRFIFVLQPSQFLGETAVMAKRHPVRNSQFMKAIRDVHSFFQEEGLIIIENLEECFKNLRPAIHQARNCFLFTAYCYNVM
jgi:hypothetical protein